MNRKQRRKLDRAVGVNGFGKLMDAMTSTPVFSDGDKVKLRYEQIAKRTDYASKTENYRRFISENRDKVFTVRRITPGKEHSLIELVEDTSEPKWLWWDGDLKRISDEDKT